MAYWRLLSQHTMVSIEYTCTIYLHWYSQKCSIFMSKTSSLWKLKRHIKKCPSVLLFIPSGQCQIFISLSKKKRHRVFWEVLDTQNPQKWVFSQWSLSVPTSESWSTRTFWASRSWMKSGSLPGTASALGKFFNSLLPMQMFVIVSFPRSRWLSKAGIVRQA